MIGAFGTGCFITGTHMISPSCNLSQNCSCRLIKVPIEGFYHIIFSITNYIWYKMLLLSSFQLQLPDHFSKVREQFLMELLSFLFNYITSNADILRRP